MPSPDQVSVTAGALLGLLNERSMTGWELVEEAWSRVGNFWTIQRSQAYRELAQLERRGFAEALPAEGRGRRRYRITDSGRQAYLDWLERSPGEENVRVPFLLTVAFADDVPEERFHELLDDQRRRHEDRLTRYEAWREELASDTSDRGRGRLATLALGIHYERAALAWLDELPSYLAGTRDAPGRDAAH